MTWHYTITNKMRELGLVGNELLAYAIMYGYSANGQGCYYGGVAYLAEMLNTSPRTVIRLLKSLEEKGLIVKDEVRARGLHLVSYYVQDLEVTNDAIEVTKCANRGDNRGDKSCNAPILNIKDNKYIYPPIYPNGYNPPKGESASKSSILQKFIDLGCDPATLNDWKAARKGAPITESVLQGMLREAKKAGITLADAVRICAEHSWRGFRADYLHSSSKGQPEKKSNTPLLDIMAKFNERWATMGGTEQ